MIKRFNEIDTDDILLYGGKGTSLGKLKKMGLSVPKGFIITTRKKGKIINITNKNDIYSAFDKLKSQYVAVRSSATVEDGEFCSFAGQFDTFLFVTRDKLISKIKKCYESVFSDKVRDYCNYKKIDIKSVNMAIVVQKMVMSDISGVCFTQNPMNYNKDEIMIEAGYGLGEMLVSGSINPDNYIVDRKTNNVIKKNIFNQNVMLTLNSKILGLGGETVEKSKQNKQKLSDIYIKKISKLAEKIEYGYKKPMDIEWAIEKGNIFILQARPITTILNFNNTYND